VWFYRKIAVRKMDFINVNFVILLKKTRTTDYVQMKGGNTAREIRY